MVRVFIRHNVRDYAAWREAYDGFGETQREHGVRAEAVYRAVDDPNDVTVTHDFDDAAAAKAFLGLADVKDAMSRAGVEGQPEIWLTEED
jgi:quinol monooxygenase YgiN